MWVMLVIILTTSGTSMTSIEFSNKALCTQAKTQLESANGATHCICLQTEDQ